MKFKKLFTSFILLGSAVILSTAAFAEESLENDPNETQSQPTLTYQTHFKTTGWTDPVIAGEISGFANGISNGLSGLKINLEDSIEYSVHVQGFGWQDYVSSGELAGRPDLNKRIEAVKVRLKGEMANNYKINYDVLVEDFGWMGTADQDEPCGTEGFGYRIDAIKLSIVDKNSTPAKQPNHGAFLKLEKPKLSYQAHVQSIGWQALKEEGQMSGTTGQGKQMEAVMFQLDDPYSTINYKVHMQTYGWSQNYRVSPQGELHDLTREKAPLNDPLISGASSLYGGTVGQKKRLEAIRLTISGPLNVGYTILYRVHVQSYGWLSWTSSDRPAGTEGLAKRIEAIEVKIVKNGTALPKPDKYPAFIKK